MSAARQPWSELTPAERVAYDRPRLELVPPGPRTVCDGCGEHGEIAAVVRLPWDGRRAYCASCVTLGGPA